MSQSEDVRPVRGLGTRQPASAATAHQIVLPVTTLQVAWRGFVGPAPADPALRSS
jgi:hypothetical protein